MPTDREQRVRWLSERRAQGHMVIADRFRSLVGKNTRYAEAIAPAPIGKKLNEEEMKYLIEILSNK